MTDQDILQRVRIVLEQEQARIYDEMTATTRAEVDALLEEVEAVILRAERIAELRTAKHRVPVSPGSRQHLSELHEALTSLSHLVTAGALG